MKKGFKVIATLLCVSTMAIANTSCENKTTKSTTQRKNSQETVLKADSQSDKDFVNETRKQAEKGNAEAQLKLGIMYGDGLYGLPQSNEESKKWTLKAARQGFSPAQYNLASLYAEEGNFDEAFKWMKKCAESGEYPYAQYMLATLLFSGLGCSQDVEEGLYWLEKAAEQGVEEAIEELNDLHG